jgi:hypothetical protein
LTRESVCAFLSQIDYFLPKSPTSSTQINATRTIHYSRQPLAVHGVVFRKHVSAGAIHRGDTARCLIGQSIGERRLQPVRGIYCAVQVSVVDMLHRRRSTSPVACGWAVATLVTIHLQKKTLILEEPPCGPITSLRAKMCNACPEAKGIHIHTLVKILLGPLRALSKMLPSPTYSAYYYPLQKRSKL